ncbi:MAG: heme oxygenase [Leptolyngbya sp. SIO4C1]|nr:heme oxygenase [Leptolyngbya sp. SIO4C1]
MSSNLAKELREGTKQAHSMTENVNFVRYFLKGLIDKNSYRKLMASLYFVYSEMEVQMQRHQAHPILSKIHFPELARRRSLEKDLQFYYGDDWHNQVAASPATQVYLGRIQDIANTAPELLIAHAYTRYMGDLSGGQILKGIAQRAMGLSGGQGTAFYEFDDIADEKAFKVVYRQRLNELPLSQATIEDIVNEANAAFGMNMKLFQELEGSVIKSLGQVLLNTLTRRRARGRSGLATAD